jgi:hypothetical protein
MSLPLARSVWAYETLKVAKVPFRRKLFRKLTCYNGFLHQQCAWGLHYKTFHARN